MMDCRIWLSEPGVVFNGGNCLKDLYSAVSAWKRPDDYRCHKTLLELENIALDQIEENIEKVIARYGRHRIAICVGSCDNGTDMSLPAHRKFFEKDEFPAEYRFSQQRPYIPANVISERFGLPGFSAAYSTACASSASAIIKGCQLIAAGFCDAAVVGGVDIASPVVTAGFSSLDSVSAHGTNPFSKNRDGITLGDGAAFFVISRDDMWDSGIQLLGYGESCDACHMTAPDANGIHAGEAMIRALSKAGLCAGEIDYINLHGTGTRLNDLMEGNALKRVFSDKIPPCSSTKPVTGHTLGAAGALELAICFSLLADTEDGVLLPVHIWDGMPDAEIPVMQFVKKGSAGKVNICMSNSFAFGGCNVSLIIGRMN